MTIDLQSPSYINGRVKILPKPVASPGKCAICGAVDRPVVDFGLDISYTQGNYGTVYLCVEDLHSIAQIIDMVPRQQLADNARETESIVKQYLLDTGQELVTHEQLYTLATANAHIADITRDLHLLKAANALAARESELESEPHPVESGPIDVIFGRTAEQDAEFTDVERSIGLSADSGDGSANGIFG